MSLHVYFCHLPYSVNVGMSWDPPDPGEDYTPCEMVVAETRGKAKSIFMRHDPGVLDILDIRTNCVERYVDSILERDDGSYFTPALPGILQAPRSEPPGDSAQARLYYRCWTRVHEIQDHAGEKCGCPEMVWDEKTQV